MGRVFGLVITAVVASFLGSLYQAERGGGERRTVGAKERERGERKEILCAPLVARCAFESEERGRRTEREGREKKEIMCDVLAQRGALLLRALRFCVCVCVGRFVGEYVMASRACTTGVHARLAMPPWMGRYIGLCARARPNLSNPTPTPTSPDSPQTHIQSRPW